MINGTFQNENRVNPPNDIMLNLYILSNTELKVKYKYIVWNSRQKYQLFDIRTGSL